MESSGAMSTFTRRSRARCARGARYKNSWTRPVSALNRFPSARGTRSPTRSSLRQNDHPPPPTPLPARLRAEGTLRVDRKHLSGQGEGNLRRRQGSGLENPAEKSGRERIPSNRVCDGRQAEHVRIRTDRHLAEAAFVQKEMQACFGE